VYPTLARSLPLKQVHVGSIPTASTVRLSDERAHDVAVAYRLAMADVWVRLPLGALKTGFAPVM
jgi:hypothetical protein